MASGHKISPTNFKCHVTESLEASDIAPCFPPSVQAHSAQVPFTYLAATCGVIQSNRHEVYTVESTCLRKGVKVHSQWANSTHFPTCLGAASALLFVADDDLFFLLFPPPPPMADNEIYAQQP